MVQELGRTTTVFLNICLYTSAVFLKKLLGTRDGMDIQVACHQCVKTVFMLKLYFIKCPTTYS